MKECELQSLTEVNSSPNASASSKYSAFETLLDGVGSNGRFQWLLIGLFMVPLSFLYGLAGTNFILIVAPPNHVCHVPGMDHFNVSMETWLNATIPWKIGRDGTPQLDNCMMFNLSMIDLYQKLSPEENDRDEETADVESNTTVEVVKCRYGWQYETDVWKETAVSYFNWVCDHSRIVPNLFTLKMVGGALGTFSFAILSDKFGRRPTFYVSLFLCVAFGPAMALASSLPVFAFFLFLYSLSFYTLYQMPYLIVMELCSEKLRSFTVISSFLSFTFAVCMVAFVAWLVAEWKMMLLIFHLPLIIFFFYWGYIPESPRWLLSQNKMAKFTATMQRIASVNGKEFMREFDQLVGKAHEEEKRRIAITKILSELVLLKHLVLTSFILSTGYMFYSAISLNLHNMTGNTFVNFFILSLFEIPGNIMGIYSSDFLGRRISSVLFQLLGAIIIIFTPLVISNKWGVLMCCGFAKMFAGGMILAVYMQVGELFPTPLRATAYGITGIVGTASTVIMPSLIALASIDTSIPYYIMFSLCIIGSLASTFLPETLGLPLPQTMKEATSIGKNQPYFSLIYKGNAHKIQSPTSNPEICKNKSKNAVELLK